MKAVVMAGGEGSRLRPLTLERPKPMVSIVNKPVVGHILDLLKRHGITEVVLTLQYLANIIQDYYGDGETVGMKIHYSIEETPLGTAGSVKHAQEWLEDTFLIISGDALTDFNLTEILNFHKAKGAEATLTLYRVPNPLEYGVVITDNEGRIRQFLEKPSWGEVFSDTINTGIYVIEPAVLELIPPDKMVDWSQDIFPQLLRDNRPMYGYVAGGYWCDVGNLAEYMRANADVLSGRVQVESLGTSLGPGVWGADDAQVAPEAQLFGPVYLGNGCRVKAGAVIRGPTVIRDDVVVDSRANIERSIIWRGSYIGERVEVRGAIIGRRCSLKASAVVFEGAVVGDNGIVGEGALIHPNVKIWPNKEIEAGATVKSSIIWGSQGRRVIFGRFGVSGVVNVDLLPEFVAKLGAAYGATLPKGSIVTMNRDPHRTPRMIKRAMIAGLPSVGINVWDLHAMPTPVARYYTRVSEVAGGVHVRLSPFDDRIIDIKFFDKRGLDIDKTLERKIENSFFREDFRRVFVDEIGAITDAPEIVERYVNGFIKALKAEVFAPAKKRIIVDYNQGTSVLVLPQIFRRLGIREVALNATGDETRLGVTEEEQAALLEQLAAITVPLQADLAARLDSAGERLQLVDNRGIALPGTTALAAVIALALRANEGGTVAVHVTQPRVIEKVAEQYGGKVIRTRADLRALMQAATSRGIVVAGDGGGCFIFPQFQPAVDGLFALVKMIELLITQQTTLAEIVQSLPPYYVEHLKVSCPWDAKGKVMRLVNQQYKDNIVDQVDGVTLQLGSEWVLIQPDADRPLFHIYGESSSAEAARNLAEKYASIVRGLQV